MGIAPPGGNAFDFSNLDIPGSAQGAILYKGAGDVWTFLPAGGAGDFLQTGGPGADPQWATVAGGGDMLAATYDPGSVAADAFDLANFEIAGAAVGDLYVRGPSGWARLPNTSVTGHVLTGTVGSVPTWAAPASASLPLIAIHFGADANSAGRFLLANGKSNENDLPSQPRTRAPIPATGTIVKLAYQTESADVTTQIKIHVNGVVQATVTLSSVNANFGGVEAVGVSVNEGDYAEIEYDAGTAPDQCIMTLLVEAS